MLNLSGFFWRIAVSTSLSLLVCSCSDSSSASAESEFYPSSQTVSSSSSGASFGCSSEGQIFSSSSSEVELPNSLNISPDTNGFYDMGELYRAVPQGSRIVFVIRHAEREDSLGTLSPLTENGVAAAQALGEKLANPEESFHYASTDFVRTRETCRNIALGRGESDFEVETWDGIDGSYFLRVSSDSLSQFSKNRGGTWKIISRWAYADSTMNETVAAKVNAHFYDLFERGRQFVEENVLANVSRWKRVSILVSHDVLTEPLVVFASNRSVDLRFYSSGRWVNYLAGVAIVIDENSHAELYPVRGDDLGFMTVSK